MEKNKEKLSIKTDVIIRLIDEISKNDSRLIDSINEEKKIFNDIKHSHRYKIGDKILAFFKFLWFLNIGKDDSFEKASKVILTQKSLLDQRKNYLNAILAECGLYEAVYDNQSTIDLLYHPLSSAVIDKSDYYFYHKAKSFSDNQLQEYLKKPFLKKPLVSIIMPTYNRSDVIMDSIQSIINQSYKNYELIIIDDGSTDDTEALVSKINHPQIKYFKQKKSGVCKARNKGLELSKGEYIAYLDSDNTWHNNFLEVFIKKFDSNQDLLIAYCGQNIFEGQTLEGIAINEFYPRILENRNYIDLNIFVHHRLIYEQLGGFDENLSRLVDWDLIFKYSNFSSPELIPVVLCDYFKGKAKNQISVSSNYRNSLKQLKKNFKGSTLDEEITKYLPSPFKKSLYNDSSNYSNKVLEKRASIIIPSFEVLDCLKSAITALEKYTPIECYELIIVDNNSSKEVKSYLIDLKKQKKAKVILNDENMGFSYAVNQGIEISEESNDIILFNNDAIVTEGWLQAIYDCHESQEKIGLIVPSQILPEETKTLNTHVPFASPEYEVDVNLSVHHMNIVSPIYYKGKKYVEISFAAFFCVFISRDCFNDLGYLDHVNGRHYKSDRLYCELAREKGWKIVYTPYSKVYHLLQQATTNLKSNGENYKTMFIDNTWNKKPSKIFKKPMP